MENKVYHCWYSQEHANVAGTVFYRREDGTEVEVTAVGSVNNENNDFYQWSDKEYRGIVVSYSRQGRKGKRKKESHSILQELKYKNY